MKRVFLMTVAATLVLASCGGTLPTDPSDPGETSPYASNVIVVTGEIVQSTSWQADKVYYLNEQIFINNGATLTIPAGTIVKFGSEGMLIAEAGATIKAIGSSSNAITFTSIRDTSAGGDSLLNDGSTPPAAGDWQGLWIYDDSNSNEFRYCTFRYAGMNNGSTLRLDGRGTIDHCTFVQNDSGLPWAAAQEAVLDARDALTGSVITNNLFYNNNWPLAISSALNLGETNSFSFDHDEDLETPALVNTRQGIYLDHDSISAATNWVELEVPFCIFDTITIEESVTLTIAAGVVCKLSGVSAGFNVYETGSMSSSGYTLTSWRDDSFHGDTNGDGNDSQAADGDWFGIYDYNIETYRARNNDGVIRYSEYTTED